VIAIVVIAVIVALWVLAVRYGYDSREYPHSKEQQLAAYGVTWDHLADPQSLSVLASERAAELRGQRAGLSPTAAAGRPFRVSLARHLRSLADRLEPAARERRHVHA
jgi:hypothetical protein